MKSIYGIFSKILRKSGPLDSNHFIWISYIDICCEDHLDEKVKCDSFSKESPLIPRLNSLKIKYMIRKAIPLTENANYPQRNFERTFW